MAILPIRPRSTAAATQLIRERFSNSRLAKNNYAGNPNGFCGYPIGGYTSGGLPANIFNGTNGSIDPLGGELANLFPAPNTTLSGGNYLADPKRSETENKFDIRGDYSISQKDNCFARYSYGKDS